MSKSKRKRIKVKTFQRHAHAHYGVSLILFAKTRFECVFHCTELESAM